VPTGGKRPRDEVARADRRWLLLATFIFAGSLGASGAAIAIYRATGPHPAMAPVIRRMKLYANQLLRHGFRHR
jgi:hypothetical protein